MFIEVDVVEFSDDSIPYRTVLLNTRSIIHVEPIAKKHHMQYEAGRNQAIINKETDSNVVVSPVESLPTKGAVMFVIGHQVCYYTITPYEEIKTNLLGVTTE
jgi:hypothetical protein